MRGVWIAAAGVVIAACSSRGSTSAPTPVAAASPESIDARPAREFHRIAVVGASVSAGFGGAPLADVLTAAIPGATITGAASVFMFRDAVANGATQIDDALRARPDLVVAIDFLFWHDYNGVDREDRLARQERGLADLDRARAAGAAVIVGDVPRILTAAELLIPTSAIPPADDLAALNARLREWARTRPDVLIVPFAELAGPLAAGADVEVAPGETLPARALMSPDGLHPNALGVWYVMSTIDRLVEAAYGVPPAAWTFARPPPPE
jgi:lysophospholipase L1-like esterase